MSNGLKDFIENNRDRFEETAPYDLWTKIDSSLKQAPPTHLTRGSGLRGAFLKKIPAMLKYGFGASALILGTFLIVNRQMEKTPVSRQNITTSADSPAPAFKIPRLNAAAALINETRSDKSDTPAKAGIKKQDSASFAQQLSGTELREDSSKKEQPLTAKVKPPYFIVRNDKQDSLAGGSNSLDTLFNGIKKIQVNVELCNINIRAVAGSQVALHGKISENAGSFILMGTRAYRRTMYKLKFETRDSVLKIWMVSEKVNQKMRSKEANSESSVLDFEVPLNTDVDVTGQSGDITVNGLQNKSTRLQTSFGNIKVEDLRSNLVARSSSGNIRLVKITGEVRSDNSFGHQVLENIKGNIKLRTSSGNSSIKYLEGDADVSTSFGDQKYEAVTGNIISSLSSGNFYIKTLVGNADVKSSFGTQNFENVTGNIVAKASSGNIKISELKGMLVLDTNFGNITGKNITLVNSGDFRTSSGNIHIDLLNEMNDLSFDLKSSSGDLLVEKNNVKNASDQRLVLGQGPILIKGVSSFGNQSYR